MLYNKPLFLIVEKLNESITNNNSYNLNEYINLDEIPIYQSAEAEARMKCPPMSPSITYELLC